MAFRVVLACVQEAPEDQEHWRNQAAALVERVHAAKRARTTLLLIILRRPGRRPS